MTPSDILEVISTRFKIDGCVDCLTETRSCANFAWEGSVRAKLSQKALAFGYGRCRASACILHASGLIGSETAHEWAYKCSKQQKVPDNAPQHLSMKPLVLPSIIGFAYPRKAGWLVAHARTSL